MRHHRHELSQGLHFQGVTRQELATIDRNVTEARFGPGEVLTKEGAYGREVFLIVDGTAEVRVGDQVIATLKAGDVAGELAVLGSLDAPRRTATVVTTSDVVALVSNPREFAAILADAPRLAERIRRGAAAKLVAQRHVDTTG